MACCVKNCKNLKRLMPPDSQISFHRVPRNDFATYMNILGQDGSTYKVRYICSLHFVDADFVISRGNRKLLKRGVIPSRNIGEAVVSNERSKSPQKTKEYWKITNEPLEDPLLLETPYVPVIETLHHQKEANFEIQDTFDCFGPQEPSESALASNFRPLELSESESSTVSADSGESANERRRQFVRAIHNYSISPQAMKRKWEESQKKLIRTSKQLYTAKRTIHRLKQKILSLQGVIKVLKKQRTLQPSG